MLNIASETDQAHGISVVRVEGRIDSDSTPQLEEALTALLDANCNKIVVNLKGVDYMSSAGLRAIMRAYQAAQKTDGSVRLAAVPEDIAAVMYTVGLNQLLVTYPTDEEAIAGF
jgi:anti-sigma B factor antagonist